ncbi:ATP-binding cassette domain-containing protein [Pannonibacter phragmitetus]|uniref:ATP-binding cassette domain-containing protein n=1 Tax=Pannonibacter phragmitetus TaxID=121719 RepID=UPI000F02CF7C|nr:ATP-binding cassette domain-containing protein [Pannonibacter phragmitetus]
MSLSVINLTVSFPSADGQSVQALKGLSLTVERGEVAGLAGASGAGKSLVAEALMGLLPGNAITGGHVTVDGQKPHPGSLALAPQTIDALDPLARTGPQLTRFGKPFGRAVDAAKLLADVGLEPEVAHAFPHELSGGMAKRVLLASALASGADFIIADEPTSGLDPDNADRIMALIASLAQKGQGLLVISHDLKRLAAIARRITVMQDGAIVETADTGCFASEGSALSAPYTRALWRAQEIYGTC